MIGKLLMFGLVFILVFNILTELYFYIFLVRPLVKKRWIRVALWLVNALFALMLLGMFLASYFNVWRVPSDWFVTYMLFYLAVYIPKFTFMVFSFPLIFCSKKSVCAKVFRVAGILAGLFLFLAILYGGTLGPRSLEVKEITVYSPDLPKSFDGYVLAHFSDMHIGNMKSDVVLRKALSQIDKRKPDLLLFTGDLVHSRTDEAYRFSGILRDFSKRADVYTILGNHDYGEYARWKDKEAHRKNNRDLVEFYKDIDWKLLRNSSVRIKKGESSIALIGVENWGNGFQKYGRLDEAIAGVGGEKYKILLSHDPSHWAEQVRGKTDIELTLSGHTHAMQFALNFFGYRFSPASWREKYWGGLYSEGGQYLYVNVGMGVTFFPFRLGAIPELTFITLRKE